MNWEGFPGHPVVKTTRFEYRGKGLIPGQGEKISYALWCGQKIKKNKKRTENMLKTLYCKYN